MDDLISRQAAIEALDGEISVTGEENAETVIRYVKLVAKRINRLPTAQPEQKKGKWIKNEDGTWSCSLCHSWISYDQHYYARYCLYCGAKMEGE